MASYKTTIETAIVDALQDEFGDEVAVLPFPDNPENYVLTHPNGATLVRYSDTRGDPTATIKHQREQIGYEVVIQSRSLRHEQSGIYVLLERCFNALADLNIGPARLRFESERFEGYVADTGVWEYVQHYVITGVYQLGI